MKKKRNFLIGFALGLLLCWVGNVLISRQNRASMKQEAFQQKLIEQQAGMTESLRNNGLMLLMTQILDKVDDEIKSHPHEMLSDGLISRIVALSFSFQPYTQFSADSASPYKLSPERGQLLMALANMDIDSLSIFEINSRATFSNADLRGADLTKANLNGINLRWADLSKASLLRAKLKDANLRDARFWGANLRESKMNESDLRRADFTWADLDGVDLNKADVSGANFTNAKLRKVDLRDATIKWTEFHGALLMGADLTRAMMLGAGLSKTNLSGAILNYADMRRTDVSQANFAGADLVKAGVEEADWLETLEEKGVTGANEVKEAYKLVKDLYGNSYYWIERKEE